MKKNDYFNKNENSVWNDITVALCPNEKLTYALMQRRNVQKCKRPSLVENVQTLGFPES